MKDAITITGIEIADLGCIREFSAKLGAVNLVIGENGQGKTTILDSVRSMFEGGSDPDMIRNGAESGTITITLSNGYSATKKITKEGYDLKVRNADGGIVKRPAEYMKALAPGLAFDPIAFLDSEPKERAAFLLRTLPLTFSADEVNAALIVPKLTTDANLQRVNELRDGVYEERRALNASVRDLEGTIADMAKALPTEDDKDWGAERERVEREIGEIAGKITATKAQIELDLTQLKGVIDEASDNEADGIRQQIATLQLKIATLQLKIREIHDGAAAEKVALDKEAAAVIAFETAYLESQRATLSLDLGTVRQRADQAQQSVGVRKAIADRRETLKGHVSREMRLTKSIKDLDALKVAKLKELPIKGLDLRMAKATPVILIDGIPLERLNRQQQIFVAIQAVSQSSGTLPLILCEVAELSDVHLNELTEVASSAGLQLILARWANGEPLQVRQPVAA